MSSSDPINKLIENISANQKKKDELEMDLKLLDSVIMTYDIDFAKLQKKEEKNKQEKLEIQIEVKKVEAENVQLLSSASVQKASRSKMLLTLQSMSVKQKEFGQSIENENTAHAAQVQDLSSKFSIVNAAFRAVE
jgi:hypothetical protein